MVSETKIDDAFPESQLIKLKNISDFMSTYNLKTFVKQ